MQSNEPSLNYHIGGYAIGFNLRASRWAPLRRLLV